MARLRFTRPDASRYWPLAAVLVAGLALTALATSIGRDHAAAKRELNVRAAVDSRRVSLQEGIRRYENVVDSLRILIEDSPELPSRGTFGVMAAALTRGFAGVKAMGWMPRVPNAQREAYELQAERDGVRDFQFREYAAGGGIAIAGTRDEYFPIFYTANGNEVVLGIDGYTDPVRRSAMDRARDTGTIAATDRARLIAANGGSWAGVLLFAPIFKGPPPATIAERRRNLAGFVVGVFQVDDMIESILDKTTVPAGLEQHFFERPEDGGRLLHAHGATQKEIRGSSRAASRGESGHDSEIAIGDKRWTVVSYPVAETFPTPRLLETWTALGSGLLVTGFAVLYVFSAIRRWTYFEGLSGNLQKSAELLRGEIDKRAQIQKHLEIASTIVDNSPIILTRWRIADPSTSQLPVAEYVSANIVQFGYTPEDIIRDPQAFESLAHPDDRAELVESVRRALADKRPEVQHTWRIVTRDRSVRWVESRLALERDEAGRVGRAQGLLRDITEQKLAEDRLQHANVLLTSAIESSPDGILAVDEAGKIIAHNERLVDMWDLPRNLVAAREDAPVLQSVLNKLKDPGGFVSRVTHLYENRDEKSHDDVELIDGRTFERHSGPLGGAGTRYFGRIWFFRDITDRKRAEEKIIDLAHHDVLTGLANRAVFAASVQQAIASQQRDDKGFAVLYLDLDHFKDVNDALGHPLGDQLLIAVGERLKGSVRQNDTVARFGGDEFAILATGSDDPTAIATLAQKLLDVVSRPFRFGGTEIRTATSIGIAIYPADAPGTGDAEALLSHADVALYRAKGDGRHIYRFFTQAMDDEVKTRFQLSNELREAMRTDQLFMEYQPEVDIATGQIVGVEGLVRWRHPLRGIVGPDEFIPVAEKSGLILPLGRWVLQSCCRQAKQWLDEGVGPTVMAINLSGIQFKLPADLEQDLDAVLAETGISPTLIELEITESTLMATSKEHNDALLRIRARGVRLAIDDFGTGYSSLDYLRRFPVDRLKIAQNFVSDVTHDTGDAVIVKAAIGLARELGLDMVAEGVETREQVRLLQSWGCPVMQGYYFSKPVPAGEAAALLRKGFIAPPHTPLAPVPPREPVTVGE